MTVSVCVVDYHGLLVGDSCISIALDTGQSFHSPSTNYEYHSRIAYI